MARSDFNIFYFRPIGTGRSFGFATEFAHESIMRFISLIICKADWIAPGTENRGPRKNGGKCPKHGGDHAKIGVLSEGLADSIMFMLMSNPEMADEGVFLWLPGSVFGESIMVSDTSRLSLEGAERSFKPLKLAPF
jgi:hypothetical protein